MSPEFFEDAAGELFRFLEEEKEYECCCLAMCSAGLRRGEPWLVRSRFFDDLYQEDAHQYNGDSRCYWYGQLREENFEARVFGLLFAAEFLRTEST